MTTKSEEFPLISIITPSFNQGQYIRDTIESVLHQNYPNLEYIIIDGGSTDNTLSVLKEYEEHLTWISEPDNGQTDAINKGIRMAHGDIIAYLNSDDTYEPDALSKVVQLFSQNDDISIIYGDFNYVNTKGNLVSHRYAIDFDSGIFRYDHCFICQPSSFWRRSVVDKVGLFQEDLHYYMDYDFYLRSENAGFQFHHIHQTLANLRLHSECKTVSGSVDARDNMQIERRRVIKPYQLDTGLPLLTKVLHKTLKYMYRIKKILRLLIESGHLEIGSHKRLMNSIYDGET